ncbi:FTR1 family iron permease [Brevibacillus borstelensis]|uniref:FTR1 family iron permease n=1 Tax=Brevibacillus borstelensis TaxID=45462 RepID=UPI0030C6383A
MGILKRTISILLLCFLLVLPASSFAAPESGAAKQSDQLISLVSDALISAGDKNIDQVKDAISKLKTLWAETAAEEAEEASSSGTSSNSTPGTSTDSPDAAAPAPIAGAAKSSGPEAKAVKEAIAAIEQELSQANPDTDAVYASVSALAKEMDAYVSSLDGESKQEKAHESIKKILPRIQNSLTAIQADKWAEANSSYQSFVNGWYKAESLIRQEDGKFYGKIEVKLTGVRIALNTEPPDKEKATQKVQELIAVLDDYLAGKSVSASGDSGSMSEIRSISDLLQLLGAVQTDVQSGRATDAADKMDQFIAAWPTVEGAVLTKSQDAYNRIENKMVSIPSLLLSQPPKLDQAEALLAELGDELMPYSQSASYTAWDAGVILFREGLEAILVIAALLTFLNRTGNADKRKWIWSGAGAGIVLSGAFALVLTMFLSHLSTGNSRELIEGITGLIAVVFMVTIGAWLHSKSNLRAWNQFVEKSIGASVAKGTLWSLALTSFLAVMREGAETIIFYIGMASSIQMSDLFLGIGVALILLAVIGFVLIKMSSRIPIRSFFLVACLLLYYLAFKFIGVSIHALQISGKLPAHMSDLLVDAPSLGLYASWEGTVPQLVVLLVIVWNIVRIERKNLKAKAVVS